MNENQVILIILNSIFIGIIVGRFSVTDKPSDEDIAPLVVTFGLSVALHFLLWRGGWYG